MIEWIKKKLSVGGAWAYYDRSSGWNRNDKYWMYDVVGEVADGVLLDLYVVLEFQRAGGSEKRKAGFYTGVEFVEWDEIHDDGTIERELREFVPLDEFDGVELER